VRTAVERAQAALAPLRARTEEPRAPSAPGAPAPAHGKEGVLERLAVRRGGVYVVLEVGDVIYFEMKDELVWAVTASDRLALDLTMTNLEQRLPDGVFFRSHRGALVRVDKIRAMEPAGAGTYELVLDHPDAPRVPLARERARLLREKIPFAG
jgi:DNA-binding LytR/AlgR family response regulator